MNESKHSINFRDLIDHQKIQQFVEELKLNTHQLNSEELENKKYEFVYEIVNETMQKVKNILNDLPDQFKQFDLLKKFINDLRFFEELQSFYTIVKFFEELHKFYNIMIPFFVKRLDDLYEELDQSILSSEEVKYRSKLWEKN